MRHSPRGAELVARTSGEFDITDGRAVDPRPSLEQLYSRLDDGKRKEAPWPTRASNPFGDIEVSKNLPPAWR